MARVNDFHPAISTPAAFITAIGYGPLLAVGNNRQLAGAATTGTQYAQHRVATPLAQSQVVLAGSTLVGMTFQSGLVVAVMGQELGMSCQNFPELRLDR